MDLKKKFVLIAALVANTGYGAVTPSTDSYDPQRADSWVSFCHESTSGVECDDFGGKDFRQTLRELPPNCWVNEKFSCTGISICDLKNWVRVLDRPQPCQQAKAIRCPGRNARDIFQSCQDSCKSSQDCLASCVTNGGCVITW